MNGTSKKYSHLFFDLDNTLWDFDKNSELAMQTVFSQLNLASQAISFSDFFEVYTQINHQLWDAYRKKQIDKNELTWKRFSLSFAEAGLRGVDPQEMNVMYLNEMPQQTQLCEDALSVLGYLNKKGYKMFIITNGFREVQLKKMESSGLAAFFTKVFISEVVKCPKPGRDIFEYAIKSTNAKKTHSLMVGDDWEVDVLGACNFGIDAVHYSPRNGRQKQQNFPSVIHSKCRLTIIHKLAELTVLL